MAERIPRPGELYRHFKNKMYQIVAIAEHSETGETLVVYQALYGNFRIFARPFDMFVGEVDSDKYPKVSQKYRFELVTSPEETDKSGRRDAGQEILREKERESRLETWKAGNREGRSGTEPDDGFCDLEDYGEAELLSDQESVVIPRAGRAEKEEDELWESLTDEVAQAAGHQDEAESVSPRFLDFLEARTFESKAVILESMREELDDELIDGLALAVDVEIPEGPLEGRYRQLRQCLQTMARYEDERLR